MHYLNNGSQVTEKPEPKSRVGQRGFFADSNDKGAPSYPGQDWFNAVITEFQNALSANGVAFHPDNFDHLQKLFVANGDQFAPYRADRVYRYGEVCSTIVDGQIKFWQWYSNVESLTEKDPLNEANRRPGWSDTAKPWYWSPFNGSRPGETVWWGGAELPEDVLLDNEQELPAVVYHRLAVARPDLVFNDVIRMKPASGRYLRAADGSSYVAGQTHEDAIRNINAYVGLRDDTLPNSVRGLGGHSGAFKSKTDASSFAGLGSKTIGGGAYSNQKSDITLDASLVVPTANQNQPVTLIEWKGVTI